MSSTAKAMLIMKSMTANDFYSFSRRLMNGKFAYQFDHFIANPSSIHVSRWSSGCGDGGRAVTPCQDLFLNANIGFSTPVPRSHYRRIIRSQAIVSTPVSNPEPITKKVPVLANATKRYRA